MTRSRGPAVSDATPVVIVEAFVRPHAQRPIRIDPRQGADYAAVSLGGRMKPASRRIAAQALRTTAVALAGCLPAVGANETAQTPTVTYTFDAHVVASGFSVTSSNACYRLRATIAEPVAGFSANANHALSAGFRAIVRGQGDDIFSTGFEACP